MTITESVSQIVSWSLSHLSFVSFLSATSFSVHFQEAETELTPLAVSFFFFFLFFFLCGILRAFVMRDLKKKYLSFRNVLFFPFFQAGLEELQDQKVAVTREKERVDHENKKLVSSR